MRVFFLQIPRTGGTSLHKIIERNYEPEEMYTVPTVSWEAANFRSLREDWSTEAKTKIKIVRGHMHYGWHHAFDDDPYTYITILRDPVERIRSLWRYVLGKEGHFLYPGKTEPPEIFVHATANGMTRMLSGMPNIENHEALALQMAKAHLDCDFSVVGFTESYGRFLEQLSNRFRWQCEMVHVNQSDHTKEFEYEWLARIENECDIALYEWARERFGT